MKLRRGRTAVAVALILALVTLAFLLRPRPERPILAATRLLAGAVMREDVGGVAERLSDALDGEIVDSKQEALDHLRRAFAEVEDLEIEVVSVETHLAGDRAEAMILYRVAGVYVGGQVYNRVPFRSFMSNDPRRPEPVYTEWAREGEGGWRLTFVTFEVHDRWDEFPESRAALGG